MSEIDEAYERTQEGDHAAFTSWVRHCETPLRKSLRSFAAVVDVEAVLQEGLARMWTLAPRLKLKGENASLRYALRLVRNVALSEARRLGRATPVELEELEQRPEGAVDPDPPTDPGLRQAMVQEIDACRAAGDSCGAVFEVIARGMPPGLGPQSRV